MGIASLTIVAHVPEHPSSTQPRPSDPSLPSTLLHHQKPILALAMDFKKFKANI